MDNSHFFPVLQQCPSLLLPRLLGLLKLRSASHNKRKGLYQREARMDKQAAVQMCALSLMPHSLRGLRSSPEDLSV